MEVKLVYAHRSAFEEEFAGREGAEKPTMQFSVVFQSRTTL